MARAVAGQGRRPDETSSAEALLEQTTKAQLAASDPAASAWVGANAGASSSRGSSTHHWIHGVWTTSSGVGV